LDDECIGIRSIMRLNDQLRELGFSKMKHHITIVQEYLLLRL
jgi:hypothetical protein